MRAKTAAAGWCLSCTLAQASAAQLAVPELVANLNQTPSEIAFTANDYAELERTTLFLTTDRFDHSLWATDGTAAGTRILADLCPSFFSCGREPTFLGANGERAFFIAHDGSGDPQLWVSDGTVLGTLVLTNFSFWRDEDIQTAVFDADRGQVFFRAFDSQAGFEPWVSDGTVAGTRNFADLAPGPASSLPEGFVPAGARVYFVARPGAGVEELWVSDGRPGGTRRLLSQPSGSGLLPLGLAPGRLVFLRATSEYGFEPWVTDGTLAGTRLLKDISPGPAGSPRIHTAEVASFGSLLLFPATDSHGSSKLWRTDGTSNGTFPLPVDANPQTLYPDTFRAGDGRFWWLQTTAGDAGDLWITDGTVAGTRRLVRACYRGCGGALGPQALFGERALVGVDDAVRGSELWTSDGTAAGTVPLKDICRGACSSFNRAVVPWNGAAAFSAVNDQGVSQLWRTDGTPEGTVPVATLPDSLFGDVFIDRGATAPNGHLVVSYRSDLESGLFAAAPAGGLTQISALGARLESSSLPSDLHLLGDRLVFQALRAENAGGLLVLEPGGTPRELRAVDFPDEAIYGINSLKVGDRLFLLNNSDRLYVTDGTSAGTRVIALPTSSRCGARRFGDRVLLFLEAGFDRDLDLWASDGTAAGTRLVSRGVGPRRCDFVPAEADLAADAFFIGSGGDLWRTDGTAAGTSRVFDFDSRPNSFAFGEIAAGSGRLWLVAAKGEQVGLWVSDGTTAGTRFVSPLLEGLDSYYEFTPIGDRVVFSAFTREHGYELWASDGTAAGTAMVKDIRPGPASSESYALIEVGGRVYFSANDGVHGDELWVTDGTVGGTRMVVDLRPGPATGRSLVKFPFRGGLLLSASDGEHGAELFVTDGTQLGTRLVADLAPGAASSLPGWMAVDGDTLYFTADDGRLGEEIWKVTIPPEPPPCTSPQDLCLHNGRIRVRVAWRDPRSGASGVGTALPFSTQSGYFWFFNPANVELVVKVLDGGPVNGHWWTFYGALSDVEYWVEVTDLESGYTETYRNPPRNICGVGDTTSLPRLGQSQGVALRLESRVSSPLEDRVASGSCASAAGTLCLLDGRFAVAVDWRNFRTGETGVGTVIPGSEQSGSFWFFNPGNLELVVKMLDGSAANGHFWFFYGALSDVEYTLRVTDTASGEEKTYANPARNICGRGDTTAFVAD